MSANFKTGPLSQADLLKLWVSVTDQLYAQPMLEAGEGHGLEVFTQQQAMMARVSEAVNRTLQAMFILPWSGESDLPARGAAFATVTLKFTRFKGFTHPVVLPAGFIVVEEVETDLAVDQPRIVKPGRLYALAEALVFMPGEAGPLTVTAVAARPGYGYNNPRPDTLVEFVQPAASFQNDGATVAPGATTSLILSAPFPDVPVPEHVGRQILLNLGANVGKQVRVQGYAAPGVADGGSFVVTREVVLVVSVVGAFMVGETVTGGTSGASGRFLKANATNLMLDNVLGTFVAGELLTGTVSAATALVSVLPGFVYLDTQLVAEVGTCGWEVLDFDQDLGFVVTNEASPVGGRSAMLDELGSERNIPRSPNEPDGLYRKRIATLPDVVSPNAIRRVANRVLAPIGSAVCLREVGQTFLFPGMYADAARINPTALDGYAYDLDSVTLIGAKIDQFFDGERIVQNNGGIFTFGRVTSFLPGVPPGAPVPLPAVAQVDVANISGPGFQPGALAVGDRSGATLLVGLVFGGLRVTDRFKLDLSYDEFRAFFLLGMPAQNLGDYGMAYDFGPADAYDVGFADGQPLTSMQLYQSVWQAVNAAKAGGVGFDLYVEDVGCV